MFQPNYESWPIYFKSLKRPACMPMKPAIRTTSKTELNTRLDMMWIKSGSLLDIYVAYSKAFAVKCCQNRKIT